MLRVQPELKKSNSLLTALLGMEYALVCRVERGQLKDFFRAFITCIPG